MGTQNSNGSDTVMLAVAVPRSALTVVAPPPDLLSQRNIEAATGIPPRTFLMLVRSRACPVSVTRLGKLRLVDRAAFVEWLRRRRSDAHEPSSENGVDELASRLGLRRVRGRR